MRGGTPYGDMKQAASRLHSTTPVPPVKIRKGGRGEGEKEEENGEETKDPNQSIFQMDPMCTREKKLKGLKEALKITLI